MLWLFFEPLKTRNLQQPPTRSSRLLPAALRLCKGAENRKAISSFDLAILCTPTPIQEARLLEAGPLRLA